MKFSPKLTNDELLLINSGINFLVLESNMRCNLEAGERMLSIRFSRPVLKRPLTKEMCDFILKVAKTHPRHWVVTVTGHYSDGKTDYTEEVELESYAKLDWLTEAYKTALETVSNAGNPRHLLGVSWRARIKTTAERRHNGNARREAIDQSSGQTAINDDCPKKQKRRA